MDYPENIWFNPQLNSRRLADEMTLDDHIQVGAAVAVAELFPDCRVDIGQRKSGVKPPEIGINLYQQSSNKRLIDTSEINFGLEITYIPEDSTDRAEINHALFLILQSLDVLQSGGITFRCYSKSTDITDGLGHVTANVSVIQVRPDDSKLIQKAEQEVY